MNQPEKQYYASHNVLVTSARAVMGGRTFAMANVTAVSPSVTRPRRGIPLMLLIVGVFTAIGSLSSSIVLALVGLVLAVGGGFWLKSLKPTYAVNIGSASGESRAMASQDWNEIAAIVAAITQAIVERG